MESFVVVVVVTTVETGSVDVISCDINQPQTVELRQYEN